MQIEGFWYYLFSGVVGAGVLHYLIAKIFGPLLFGRGWCGYACWTAMILSRHGLPQADEPLLLAAHPLRREQMHPVWQMPESVFDGSGSEQRLTQTKKRHRVHPLP